MEFLLFSTMPLFVEMVMPIRTGVTVHLIVFFAIDAFEDIRARLTFLHSKPWRVHFHVFLAALCFLPVILRVVRSIAFGAPGCMRSACEH